MFPAAVVFAVCFTASMRAEDGSSYSPQIAGASNEAKLAIPRFQIPDGMTADVFAAEPLLANPVAFCIDAKGRFYVCETFRQQKGVEDNRYHMGWLLDDLAAQTVDDRLQFFKKHLGDHVSKYAIEHDRIRLIEDADGDGKAEKVIVFADGFNQIVEGTGAGVLARGKDVYYTCIPNLWKLTDANGDGRSDARKSLSSGYGVRVAFRGHDMHGLVMGPDGRLYFSIGDRGFHVETPEGRTLHMPDTGAVFRCEPDGSELEVFAYGLRNPQELAFDDFGNLFTGDNNSDSGDKARWVYVVKGGDSGWRMYYQYLEDRGPWNRERMWHPWRADEETTAIQPAYIVPPIANIADGPSGLVHYPGVGLSDRYKGHFFLADFRGTANNSGIRSFAVKPKGASFELFDSHEFVWSILATDVDFGADGSLYVTDWVNGWDGEGKGRIYRFTDEKHIDSAALAITRAGFAHRSVEELVGLLNHRDRRIRQEAQFALVDKQAGEALADVAANGRNRIARLQAIWGIGQIARKRQAVKEQRAARALYKTLLDADPEIRAQSARVFGDLLRYYNRKDDHRFAAQLRLPLLKALEDESPRVRFFAAIGLGNSDGSHAVSNLLDLLVNNAGEDPMLQHAGVMGLAGIAEHDPNSLLDHVDHPSRYVRLGVLLALRRQEHPAVARFLDDAEPALALEAARAINDAPIDKATKELAERARAPGMSPEMLRRVLNANFRIGGEVNATAVADVAADPQTPEALRIEALAELKAWNDPPQLDRVTGAFRPVPKRSLDSLPAIISPRLAGVLSGSEKVRQSGIQLAAKYGVKKVGPALFKLAEDDSQPAGVRVEAVRALDAMQHERLEPAMQLALRSDAPELRSIGRRVLARIRPDVAAKSLDEALEKGAPVERQEAVDVLAGMKTPAADKVLGEWLNRLAARDVPPEIELDLLQVAAARNTPEFRQSIERYEAARPAADPLAKWRECLVGGNAKRGEDIFFGRTAVSCRRCHKVDDSGRGVGPELSSIAIDKKRDYLLESLVLPNKTIAKGFETAVVAMDDGKVYVGVVKKDDGKSLQLMTKEGAVVTLEKDRIDDRAEGKSAMPEDLIKHLTKSDLRDLVEYLAQRKTPKDKTGTKEGH